MYNLEKKSVLDKDRWVGGCWGLVFRFFSFRFLVEVLRSFMVF